MVGGDFANILKLYTVIFNRKLVLMKALDEDYVRHYIAEIVLALEYLRNK